jgi:hypothetical protein
MHHVLLGNALPPGTITTNIIIILIIISLPIPPHSPHPHRTRAHVNSQELKLYRCNDLVGGDVGMWSCVATCTQLRSLTVEGLNTRVSTRSLAALAHLPNVSLH